LGRWLSVSFWRIVGFLSLALIIWLILTQPVVAAGIVNSIASLLKAAATNITRFFVALF
jgi:hypothetical protein